MHEKSNHPQQQAGQFQTSGPEGASFAPPPFQLKAAAPIQMAEDTCDPEDGTLLDFPVLAQNVYDAMKGGLGLGTDEKKVYDNLGKLENDGANINDFKSVYLSKFGVDIETHIHEEFSDSAIWGPQKTIALGYLVPSTPDTRTSEPEETEPEGPTFELDEEKANGTDGILLAAEEVAEEDDRRHQYDINREKKEKIADKTAEKVAAGMDPEQAAAEAEAEVAAEYAGVNGTMCSVFVQEALEENDDTSDQYNAVYKDPATGSPVAYRADGSFRVVKNNEVINVWPKSTRAIMDAQTGDAVTVPTAAEDLTRVALVEAYGNKVPAEEFLYVDMATNADETFAGVEVEDDMQFGAGLAAVSMGGKAVEEDDRRPGDLRQSLKVDDGEFGLSGHSAIIYEVKGEGTVYWEPDNANCPIPDGEAPESAGWYTGKFIINGATNPFYVAQFKVAEVKLIDANEEDVNNESGQDRGDDATQVGDWRKANSSDTQKLSIGRLPDSKWFPWEPWEVSDAKAIGEEVPEAEVQ